MTSPPPTRDTARYRCDTCGKEYSASWYRLARLLGSLIHTDDRGRDCLGEIEREAVAEMPIARDDRAGVTLAIGVQPVGGDELVAAGPGQGEQVADRRHGDSIATATPIVDVNRPAPGGPSGSVDFTERNHA